MLPRQRIWTVVDNMAAEGVPALQLFFYDGRIGIKVGLSFFCDEVSEELESYGRMTIPSYSSVVPGPESSSLAYMLVRQTPIDTVPQSL